MKSVCSLRSRSYSSAIGSLTLSSRSASPQTSSAVGTICAPGGDVVPSGIEEPSPAPCSTSTVCPARTSSVHPGRGERDPVLAVLDLSGDPDLHLRTPLVCWRSPSRGDRRGAHRVVDGPVGACLGAECRSARADRTGRRPACACRAAREGQGHAPLRRPPRPATAPARGRRRPAGLAGAVGAGRPGGAPGGAGARRAGPGGGPAGRLGGRRHGRRRLGRPPGAGHRRGSWPRRSARWAAPAGR